MTSFLWGARFDAPPDAQLIDFASSFRDDLAIAAFDIRASRAHVLVLERAQVVSSGEACTLDNALVTVGRELADRSFDGDATFEDIHSAIEARVSELAGAEVGGKLHSGRSRNDQVATAIALFARDGLGGVASDAAGLAVEFLDAADRELTAESLMPGTTHCQPAQPILIAFWLHAAGVGVARQIRRLDVMRDSMNRCPLGAAALAGSSLPLDRRLAAAVLDFTAGPSENALDSVGDRDMVLDTLYACSTLLVHLSRVAAELIAWCSPLVGFVRLSDDAATGSSIMPHKRNPDTFELVRAKAASVAALLTSVFAQLKGLPISYHRDLQESKRALIAGLAETQVSVRAFRRAFSSISFDRARCNAAVVDPFVCSTDLAERMILGGVPFRAAHAAVGGRIKTAEAAGAPLCGDDGAPLDPLSSVRAKATLGSTNPSLLRQAILATRISLLPSLAEAALYKEETQ
jgi:argininosuccinate lyase